MNAEELICMLIKPELRDNPGISVINDIVDGKGHWYHVHKKEELPRDGIIKIQLDNDILDKIEKELDEIKRGN